MPLVTLRRTACFGLCPVYELTVYQDGRVRYFGRHWVKQCGLRADRLTPSVIPQLRAAFARADYFALADEYARFDATDFPEADTSYCDGTRAKSIAHYHGDGSTPPVLTQLEKEIDAIVHTGRWLGTDRDVQKMWDSRRDPCSGRQGFFAPSK